VTSTAGRARGGLLAAAAALTGLLGLPAPGAAAAVAGPAAATPSATPKASTSATPRGKQRSTAPARPAVPVRPAPPAIPSPVALLPRPGAGCPPQLGVRRLTGPPWAQQALDIPGAWAASRGRGVTVAVVDSGVDYSPQLAGRVTEINLTGQGPRDCVGHGTAVASIIAASDARARGIPFYGVAPAARILSVKVNTGDTGDTRLLARGIRDAVADGARVINVSIQTAANSPALRAAVTFALRRNDVVVAAAGNDNPGGGVGPYYPASYPGVISVGAVDETGTLTSYTDRRTRVSVTAPGANIASAWPGGYNPANQGTSFAAAFVSGVAALVLAADPQLSAAQVVDRIESTADGQTGAHSGAGMVNPVQAVTAIIPAAAARPAVQPVPVPQPPEQNPVTRTVALSIAGGAVGLAALVVAAAAVVTRGRRRHWRPAGRR
jgi:membrane-anchored mycosin MYCP